MAHPAVGKGASMNVIKLAASIGLCLIAGALGSMFTTPQIPGWYANLAKPSFNPPSWLFGPVWTALYVMMGISLFLVWRAGLAERRVQLAVGFFIAQLACNVCWSYAFFGRQSPLAGLVVIVALWILIVITILASAPVSKAAALLLIPYLLWVSFASILNASLWRLNR
jgi:tryptophan-rich sensory protein